jgi:hypothetical protein
MHNYSNERPPSKFRYTDKFYSHIYEQEHQSNHAGYPNIYALFLIIFIKLEEPNEI